MNSEFTHAFFEEASTAWNANKVKYDQSMYRYKKNAFPADTSVPKAPILTRAQKVLLDKECAKRALIDEPVPPSPRRSPRLAKKQRLGTQ